MISQEELFLRQNIQLIDKNRSIATWKKAAIITGIFLLSPLPGSAIGYFYSEKLTTELDSENNVSLPISMLIGSAVSSLLILGIVTPFFYKKTFSSWYQQLNETRNLNKYINDIEKLETYFNNVTNNSDNNPNELSVILMKLNNVMKQLEKLKISTNFQQLENLKHKINNLNDLVINKLDGFYPGLVEEVNNQDVKIPEFNTSDTSRLLVY